MVRERAERLPGWNLVAKPYLEVFHLVECVVSSPARGAMDGHFRHDLSGLGPPDLLRREAEKLKLPPQRPRSSVRRSTWFCCLLRSAAGVVPSLTRLAIRSRSMVARREIGGGLRQFDLRGLQDLADQFHSKKRCTGHHGVPRLGQDLGDDAGHARRDAAIALAGPIHHHSGDDDRSPVFARLRVLADSRPEVLLGLLRELMRSAASSWVCSSGLDPALSAARWEDHRQPDCRAWRSQRRRCRAGPRECDGTDQWAQFHGNLG